MHTLGDIARFIDAELIGDASLEINSLSASSKAKKGQLTYIANSKYKLDLLNSNASAVILTILQDDYIGLYDDIITNCNALLNCRICTYGTIFANNNGFGNGATISQTYSIQTLVR
jgi:UDP-3-O-[3-hydroxymyristoyl] glucosamine N-acyltransferase